jgi:DNA adenine methylase
MTLKPYLKWAGGKRQLLPEIRRSFPPGIENYNYIEPFVGAGAVFFDLLPKKAVINDANSQLILTYTAIKNNVEELIALLEHNRQKISETYYYMVRDMDRNEGFCKLSDTEKAARFIFLNKTCYNGLYRVNSQGLFNVPYGRFKNPLIYSESNLREISKYLNTNDISIINGDFELAVANADMNAFVYFDPPYHSLNKANFTRYQADNFNDSEQERLRNLFLKLTEMNVKCLLSNSDTPFIRDLYDHGRFTVSSVQAKRFINSNPKGRGVVSEVLIRNW